MRWVLILSAALALAACETTDYGPPSGTEQSVSIPYDPYNYDPAELDAQAESHCSAYKRRALYRDETIDPNSVRWRYRHYDCIPRR